MEAETIKFIVQIAGVGGLGLAVFLIIFREVIRKNIFPQLQNEHSYRIILAMLSFTFVIALAGLGSWVWIQTKPNTPEKKVSEWDHFDGEYKLMLLDLAKEGCYFFRWNRSNILESPDFIEEAQHQYAENKISTATADDPLLVVGFKETGGPLAYAQKVSERHAVTVKNYLSNEFDLPSNAISTIGIGAAGNPPRVDNYFCGAKLVLESEYKTMTKFEPVN
ncbi:MULTISPECIES: OmpA family protein [unclassified Pseudomonas]|uniref:OmpA family protein n=1 Tax=unclassified Pseudomonas TaxID=196821 RepID=UPI0021C5D739|nr:MULTISPECIES: OmpA family protein [unclassified Pseudomonas]MCU1732302.1 hypothetical protein [Pseudomonas sp. 20P_3.2_Bac4]MCU1746685.1 hypothetical protein [Pseudomonas sp. 20P_3.2_Bac5]